MEQDDTSVLFVSRLLVGYQSPQGEPLPLRRTHHRRDFHEKAFAAQAAFQISRPGLRLRQERDARSHPDQLRGQFKLGQCRLSNAVIIMSQPMDEAAETETTRLIGAMPVQGRPPLFEVARQALLLTFPGGKRRTVSFTEMRNQSEGFSWTKARHRSYRLRVFVVLR